MLCRPCGQLGLWDRVILWGLAQKSLAQRVPIFLRLRCGSACPPLRGGSRHDVLRMLLKLINLCSRP